MNKTLVALALCAINTIGSEAHAASYMMLENIGFFNVLATFDGIAYNSNDIGNITNFIFSNTLTNYQGPVKAIDQTLAVFGKSAVISFDGNENIFAFSDPNTDVIYRNNYGLAGTPNGSRLGSCEAGPQFLCTTGQLFAPLTTHTPMNWKIMAMAPTVAAVPIPAAIWMFVSGLLGFGAFHKKKAKSQNLYSTMTANA